MAQGQELFQLIEEARSKGITMSEMGRRGGLTSAAKKRREKKNVPWYVKAAKKHSDEKIASMPYMD